MIKLTNVTHKYITRRTETFVLNDVNLTIYDGDIIGIIGVSGAGKSTLIRTINGLIKPTLGTVEVDKIDINMLNSKELNKVRKNMGMIFQHYNLLEQKNVYENIHLMLKIGNYSKTEMDTRINEVLELVKLTDKKNSFPSELSGGEKQRVGIARALANHPKYLLCDEATSALDPKTANEIVLLLKDIHLKLGITIIFISHQMEIIMKLCNRLAVIDEGIIVEDSSVLNAFTDPKNQITKDLIRPIIAPDKKMKPGAYELIYTSDVEEETILSDLIKKHQVDISITHAKILELSNQQLGYLYITIAGNGANDAIKDLRCAGIEVNLYE